VEKSLESEERTLTRKLIDLSLVRDKQKGAICWALTVRDKHYVSQRRESTKKQNVEMRLMMTSTEREAVKNCVSVFLELKFQMSESKN
jgi:hypothetical protein